MFGSLIKSIHPYNSEKERLDPVRQWREQLASDQLEVMRLLPIVQINLAQDDLERIQNQQMASLVLGPAASAPMVCSENCPTPFQSQCPLAQMNRAPYGERCPFEQQYVVERFMGWMSELGRTLGELLESERSAITSLVILDLQEKRCAAILAEAENALLVTKNVRDVDVQSGTPIAWDEVVHANAERMNQIIDKRRVILRDLELTPEMQTKRKKALGLIDKGNTIRDLASRQSDNSDKIRRALRGEVQTVDIP
jgi:hypothetical protein